MGTDEQQVGEDVVVVPELTPKDRKEIIKAVKDVEKKELKRVTKECIVCGAKATYCMRGLPNNTYCKACAQQHFKFLNYLEKL